MAVQGRKHCPAGPETAALAPMIFLAISASLSAGDHLRHATVYFGLAVAETGLAVSRIERFLTRIGKLTVLALYAILRLSVPNGLCTVTDVIICF